jgi:hypothetical protein
MQTLSTRAVSSHLIDRVPGAGVQLLPCHLRRTRPVQGSWRAWVTGEQPEAGAGHPPLSPRRQRPRPGPAGRRSGDPQQTPPP